MTTEDFIIDLFCRVDDKMFNISKHPQSKLYPSEIVTLGLVFAIKGVGNRAFYRWFVRDFKHLFPQLPERTRLFRLFAGHWNWTKQFWADPTILGVADSYGLELVHPMREGRSNKQIGKKGISNHRWIVGAKVCIVLNQWGLVAGWACATANSHDSVFRSLISDFEDRMIVLADSHFHSKVNDLTNIKICKRGTWNVRMVVETVLSMLTTVCHFKKIAHRVWDYLFARLSFTLAAFNILAQWNGLVPDEKGHIHLSIAEFSL